MSILKISMWLSLYFIIYILFSSNTLISIFCFIIVIINISILLFSLHIEYITYLLLLLYLGGIFIFFLFTALMLNNEYLSSQTTSQFSFDNIIICLFLFKFFFFFSKLNFNFVQHNQNFIFFEYFPNYLNNGFFLGDLLNNHSDLVMFSNLFIEKYFLLFILGSILLFTMVGVIVITKK